MGIHYRSLSGDLRLNLSLSGGVGIEGTHLKKIFFVQEHAGLQKQVK